MKSSKLHTGKNVLVSLILFMAAYLLVGGSWIGAAAVVAASGGAPVPDMLFSYAPGALPGLFEALGAEGRAAYLSMNAVDFLFAGAYGAFYFLALGWIALYLFPAKPALRFVGMIGVAAALCDEAENLVFRLAASGAAVDGPAASFAAAASTAKYCLVSASMALIAVGSAAAAIAAARRRLS
jgi:hypothetical protein